MYYITPGDDLLPAGHYKLGERRCRPARPAMESALRKSAGCGWVFPFTVTGTPTIPIAVEVSTNLITWSRLLTTNLVDGSMSFEDPEATNFSRCFYHLAGW